MDSPPFIYSVSCRGPLSPREPGCFRNGDHGCHAVRLPPPAPGGQPFHRARLGIPALSACVSPLALALDTFPRAGYLFTCVPSPGVCPRLLAPILSTWLPTSVLRAAVIYACEWLVSVPGDSWPPGFVHSVSNEQRLFVLMKPIYQLTLCLAPLWPEKRSPALRSEAVPLYFCLEAFSSSV